MGSDEYPKCIYCGKPILWFNKMPYDATIPEHLHGTFEGFMCKGKLIRHHCSEYFEAKAAEEDPPLWDSIINNRE